MEEEAARVMDLNTQAVTAALPDSAEAAAADLEVCQAATHRIQQLVPELEALAALQEELKECVSPSDIKQTTQRAWLLWQRQADLIHQLALRMQELEGRSALLDLFRTQHSKFLAWVEATMARLESGEVSGMARGLKAQVSGREQELVWLERAADQLVGHERTEVEEAAAEARRKYLLVVTLLTSQLTKQRNTTAAQSSLEAELKQLVQWLAQFEDRVRRPQEVRGTSLQEYKAALEDQASLDREVNQHSGSVSTVLNDGEVLLLDSPSPDLARELAELEEAWTRVCSLTATRGVLLEKTWSRWQHLLEMGRVLTDWLDRRGPAASMEPGDVRMDLSTEKQKELDKIMTEFNEKEISLEEFKTVYCDLAKEGQLDDKGEMKTLHGQVQQGWKNLSKKTVRLIGNLADLYSRFESLLEQKESEMIALRQLDAEVTEVQASTLMEDDEKRRRLLEALKDLKKRKDKREWIRSMTEEMRDKVHTEDILTLDSNAAELSALHDDVKARILRLMDDLCVETFEIDEIEEKESEKMKEIRSPRQITITVHKARKLEKKGFFGKADPYVLLTLGDLKNKSHTVKNSQNPEWQHSTTLTLDEFTPSQLRLDVFDEDIGSDDHMGAVTIDLSPDHLAETWIPLLDCKSGAVLVSMTSEMKADSRIPDSGLRFERDRGVQVDTLPLPPDSGFMSGSVEDSEWSRRVNVCRADIANLEKCLDITEDKDILYSELAKCRSSLELCRVCPNMGEEGRTGVAELGSLILLLEARIAERLGSEAASSSPTPGRSSYAEVVRSTEASEAPGSPASTCPLCRRRNWRQVEGDLWRLERWLEHSSASLADLLRRGVPSSIEHLEEVIQDHRDFLLQLDSHKSVAMSINVVGSHLAEHAINPQRAQAMEARLIGVNGQWDGVCEQATLWQTRLQTALLENGEFHATIQELLTWLDATTAKVRQAEPVDLRVERSALETKHGQLVELSRDLARCEPRVVSLQEAADQLELQADSPACRQVKRKLALLSRSLRGLRQVVGIYTCSLARALGLPPPPDTTQDSAQWGSEPSLAGMPMPVLTDRLRVESQEEGDSALPVAGGQDHSEEFLQTGVLARSYRFLGRVVRAAVPIQALMLLLLGVSSIVPLDQDELVCSLQNNLQRSLEPMLQWSNGPPPI